MTSDILVGGASPSLPTAYGKITRYLVPYLVEIGYKVSLFSPSYRGEESEYSGAKLIGTYEGATYSSTLTGIRLDSAIKREKPKVVITIGDILLLGGLIKENRDYKLICYFPIDGYPWRPKEVQLWRDIDYKVVPSKWAIEVINRYGMGFNTYYIPHGVDLNIYRPLNHKEDLKTELGLDKDDFLFLSVSTNNLRKNIGGLLEAFSLAIKEIPNAYLCLTCCEKDYSGYDLPPIIDYLGLTNRVLFPEDINAFSLPEIELVKLYNASDAFVTATTGEGAFLPAYESLACGLPIIAPNHTALTELLSGVSLLVPCKGGFYDPFGTWRTLPDLRKLVESIILIFKDKELRERLKRKGLERAKEYDWRKVLPAWKSLLEEVM